VRSADLHETDYTPWEGHDIFAWPVTTILRGTIVVDDGRFRGREGAGRYLKRKIADEMLDGPAL
jgi:dihydropyrimidinase